MSEADTPGPLVGLALERLGALAELEEEVA
jgi:hypothetical protein